jgi:hypothetical protein
MIMIWWMNAFDYPIVVGGKPMFSPYSAFPPSYELTILFGAFGSLFGMLFLNRLPRLHHPLLKNKRFSLVTHDRFFIAIECADPNYSENETRALLQQAGSPHIEVVRNNALFPPHFSSVLRRRGRDIGQARNPFQKDLALYFPRYGMAAQIAARKKIMAFLQTG